MERDVASVGNKCRLMGKRSALVTLRAPRLLDLHMNRVYPSRVTGQPNTDNAGELAPRLPNLAIIKPIAVLTDAATLGNPR